MTPAERVAAIEAALRDRTHFASWEVLLDEVPALLADYRALREALVRHGEHIHEWTRDSRGNAVVQRFCPDEDTDECFCGLDAALGAVR